jgi:osmotically-inducible protein OsmY
MTHSMAIPKDLFTRQETWVPMRNSMSSLLAWMMPTAMISIAAVAAPIAAEYRAALQLTAQQVVDDGFTTAAVKTALIGDPRMKGQAINVNARQGVVQLNGHVDSDVVKAAATEIALSVEGVRAVDNQLNVRS